MMMLVRRTEAGDIETTRHAFAMSVPVRRILTLLDGDVEIEVLASKVRSGELDRFLTILLDYRMIELLDEKHQCLECF
jgi:hypothetical protein